MKKHSERMLLEVSFTASRKPSRGLAYDVGRFSRAKGIESVSVAKLLTANKAL